MTGTATKIVLSFPTDLSDWGRRQVSTPWFQAYLRKTLGEVSTGDMTEEFLDVGCCGSTLDVPLRVERVEDGPLIDGDTEIEYEVREACGVEGGWKVQSRSGPTAGSGR